MRDYGPTMVQASPVAVTQAISSLNLQPGGPTTSPSWENILDLSSEQNAAALPLLTAAAVVPTFSTEFLVRLFGQSLGASSALATAALVREIVKHSRRIDVGIDKGRHALDFPVRRAVFRSLGTAEQILQAAERYKDNRNDTTGIVLREFLRGKLRSLESLNRSELVALGTIHRWLDGIVDGLPSDAAITARLAEVDLLLPLERLLRYGFVGRERELRSLREYVDAISSQSIGEAFSRFTGRWFIYAFITRPPLMIFGPGGVGKSTLVAKFIVDHLKGSSGQRTPFVYIDFDRISFREPQPTAMLLEFLQQLSIQFPSMLPEVKAFRAEQVMAGRRYDVLESSKNTMEDEFGFEQISHIVSKHVSGSAPILLTLDTVEELEFLGREIVYNYISALGQLLQRIPRLRIVIAGRSDIDDGDITTKKIQISGFDPESAEVFIKRYLEERVIHQSTGDLSPDIISAVVRAAGGSPLTLVLAAENLIRAVENSELASVDSVVAFMKELEESTAQEQLYGRFLDHIHDKALRAVAYPGLVLRRIDGDVLLNVLAKPCHIEITEESEAQRLVDSLQREGTLVEPENGGLGIRHRSDVRRLMLPDIEKTVPQKARSIERRAAGYYHGRFERTAATQDRAEEIYHRMRLGFSPRKLDTLWVDGVRPYLQDSINEVPTQIRFWLTEKLHGGSDNLSTEILDQVQWERVAERRAGNLLAAGNAQRAVAVLRERDPTTFRSGSPLFALFVDALRLLGDTDEALGLISIGVAGSRSAETMNMVADLSLHEANIYESDQYYYEALQALRRVETRLYDIDRLNQLRHHVTKARILRKIIQD